MPAEAAAEQALAGQLPMRLPFWRRGGTADMLLLFFWTLALNGFGLGQLEFLRHTEADRTLISWEMLETGDYLVPHLLHSVILTKPPLYYWLAAGSMSFWGAVSEWAARFPSLCASIIFVLLQYCAVREITRSRSFALLSAVFLSTSMAFFVRSVAAEIDMLFALFCAASFYACCLATMRSSLGWTLAAYAAAALAFLTKGLPAVLFFAVIHFTFFAACRGLRKKEPAAPGTERTWTGFLLFNTAGVFVFLAAVSTWLVPFARRVGWSALLQVLRVESIGRAIGMPRISRGCFFYFQSLFVELAPWSLILVLGILNFVIALRGGKKRLSINASPYPEFFLFNLLAVAAVFLVLTLAQGKASRYLFPVHPLAVNLAVFAAFSLIGTKTEQRLYKAGAAAGFLGIAACLAAPFAVTIAHVTRDSLTAAAVALIISFVFLIYAGLKKQAGLAVGAVAVLILALRVAQVQVYVPYRNATRSVKSVALGVNEIVAPGVPVYTVEMYERWVNYYLKRLGRESIRLTPENCGAPRGDRGAGFLLLNLREESWRLDQLQQFDPAAQVVEQFSGGKEQFLLVKAEAGKLCLLQPEKMFPVLPTKPYAGPEGSYPPRNSVNPRAFPESTGR